MSDDTNTTHENNLPLQDEIYIGMLRSEFDLSIETALSLFDDDFLSQHSHMTTGSYKGEPYSRELAEDSAGLYTTAIVTESVDDILNPSGLIESVIDEMKHEAYAKLGYAPDGYGLTLKDIKTALVGNYGIVSDYRVENTAKLFHNLCNEHIFDLTLVNKKAAERIIREYKANTPDKEAESSVIYNDTQALLIRNVVRLDDVTLRRAPKEIVDLWRRLLDTDGKTKPKPKGFKGRNTRLSMLLYRFEGRSREYLRDKFGYDNASNDFPDIMSKDIPYMECNYPELKDTLKPYIIFKK